MRDSSPKRKKRANTKAKDLTHPPNWLTRALNRKKRTHNTSITPSANQVIKKLKTETKKNLTQITSQLKSNNKRTEASHLRAPRRSVSKIETVNTMTLKTTSSKSTGTLSTTKSIAILKIKHFS